MSAHSHKQPGHGVTRTTFELPVKKHKDALKTLENDLDVEAFDSGTENIQKHGYDTLDEVKKYLGVDK